MSDLLEYKCPCCGGAIEFDSSLQKMKCPYCDAEFEPEALKDYDKCLSEEKPEKMDWETKAGSEWDSGETNGMSVYSCKSCGGEIVGDENMAATSCPFCGNPIVMTGQFSGALKPDYVIPFKLDKTAAKAKLNEHLKGKFLLPDLFKDQNHIEEVKGVYVPFWLFDADADADLQFDATKTRFWSDSSYDYTETSHYSALRSGKLRFTHVPVDGSSKLDDTLMQSVEPFDFKDALDFQTAYLAGYVADKYDVSADDSITAANKRVKCTVEDKFRDTVKGYSTVTPKTSNIRLANGKAKYALYPVWLLSTKWNDTNYLFAMNGQTGKFVGDLPVDKKKLNTVFAVSAIIAAAIAYGIMWLI